MTSLRVLHPDLKDKRALESACIVRRAAKNCFTERMFNTMSVMLGDDVAADRLSIHAVPVHIHWIPD
jgi:hypothetical protein